MQEKEYTIMAKQKICAIIVAGGKGRRMGGNIPKQFMKLDNDPVIIRTLQVFEASKMIDTIVLILPKKWKKKAQYLLNKYRIKKVTAIAPAGRTRQSSVYNGLVFLKILNPDIVVIHDVARPFVTKTLIEVVCINALRFGAVSCSIPVRDALYEKRRKQFLNRKNIVRVQTPQAFTFSLLLNAHMRARKRKRWDFPDDSSLLLSYRIETVFINGDERNIKITDREDLKLARAIARG